MCRPRKRQSPAFHGKFHSSSIVGRSRSIFFSEDATRRDASFTSRVPSALGQPKTRYLRFSVCRSRKRQSPAFHGNRPCATVACRSLPILGPADSPGRGLHLPATFAKIRPAEKNVMTEIVDFGPLGALAAGHPLFMHLCF